MLKQEEAALHALYEEHGAVLVPYLISLADPPAGVADPTGNPDEERRLLFGVVRSRARIDKTTIEEAIRTIRENYVQEAIDWKVEYDSTDLVEIVNIDFPLMQEDVDSGYTRIWAIQQRIKGKVSQYKPGKYNEYLIHTEAYDTKTHEDTTDDDRITFMRVYAVCRHENGMTIAMSEQHPYRFSHIPTIRQEARLAMLRNGRESAKKIYSKVIEPPDTALVPRPHVSWVRALNVALFTQFSDIAAMYDQIDQIDQIGDTPIGPIIDQIEALHASLPPDIQPDSIFDTLALVTHAALERLTMNPPE